VIRFDQLCHATDLVPTIYDCLGIALPEVIKGFPQIPLEGTSMRYSFDQADAPTRKEPGFSSMLGSRAGEHYVDLDKEAVALMARE
jgi:arylsulfatase A-like enzyme